MPLAHDFYYNPAAFHYAETYRYRAAAAEMHESRWPAGSELPLPPPAAPYILACSAPAPHLPALRPHFLPARGGGSLLGRVTAHRGGAGRRYWSGSNPTHVPRRGGGGEPPPPSVDLGLTGGRPITWPAETVAEPLPHAHLLGLQAYSLHLPVPQLQHIVDAGGSLRRGIDGDGGGGAAAGPDAVLSGAEEGLAVQLPLPAAWRAALNSSSGTNIDVEGHARTMPEPSIENWVVPTTDVPVLSKRQRRRARRARRKAQSGLPKRASTFSA
jgi:hypothetical protein